MALVLVVGILLPLSPSLLADDRKRRLIEKNGLIICRPSAEQSGYGGRSAKRRIVALSRCPREEDSSKDFFLGVNPV